MEESENFVYLSIEGRIILSFFYKISCVNLSTGFVWLKIEPMADSFELAVNLRAP